MRSKEKPGTQGEKLKKKPRLFAVPVFGFYRKNIFGGTKTSRGKGALGSGI